MTKWQRFGDDTWVNVDHVEVVRVEEQEDGSWQLTAAFASGQTHPLGSHPDRDLLLECTDVLLRDEVGAQLRALTDTVEETVVAPVVDPDPEIVPVPAKRMRWWLRRSGSRASVSADSHPDTIRPQPAA